MTFSNRFIFYDWKYVSVCVTYWASYKKENTWNNIETIEFRSDGWFCPHILLLIKIDECPHTLFIIHLNFHMWIRIGSHFSRFEAKWNSYFPKSNSLIFQRAMKEKMSISLWQSKQLAANTKVESRKSSLARCSLSFCWQPKKCVCSHSLHIAQMSDMKCKGRRGKTMSDEMKQSSWHAMICKIICLSPWI